MIVFILSILLMAAPPDAPEQPQADIEIEPAHVVAVKDANLHREASKQSRVVSTVRARTQLVVIGHSEGWLRVSAPNDVDGWISRELVETPAEPGKKFAISAMPKKQPSRECAADFDSCPVAGCADTEGEKAINTLKRHQVESSGAKLLSFADFLKLQGDCMKGPNAVGEGATPSAKDRRTKLHGLPLKDGRKASEGDVVMLAGYLVGKAEPMDPEGVNCSFTGKDRNDFHVPVAASPRSTEYRSVVVEMIPQKRPEGWTTPKLHAAQRAKMPVFVVGQLLYDGRHFLNNRPNLKSRRNQPKRLSLWEIHPVSAFFVCPTLHCDMQSPQSDGWVKLADWAP